MVPPSKISVKPMENLDIFNIPLTCMDVKGNLAKGMDVQTKLNVLSNQAGHPSIVRHVKLSLKHAPRVVIIRLRLGKRENSHGLRNDHR